MAKPAIKGFSLLSGLESKVFKEFILETEIYFLLIKLFKTITTSPHIQSKYAYLYLGYIKKTQYAIKQRRRSP